MLCQNVIIFGGPIASLKQANVREKKLIALIHVLEKKPTALIHGRD